MIVFFIYKTLLLRIGYFDSKEEFECVKYLDKNAVNGRSRF